MSNQQIHSATSGNFVTASNRSRDLHNGRPAQHCGGLDTGARGWRFAVGGAVPVRAPGHSLTR
jgi:hypothetical protein